MSKEDEKAEAKLARLGERLERGFAKLHPISEKHLEAVRQAVRERWQENHKGVSHSEGDQGEKNSESGTSREQEKDASKDQGKDQEHGHEH
jgi:hypothetical protein